jgi:hypothetical protein
MPYESQDTKDTGTGFRDSMFLALGLFIGVGLGLLGSGNGTPVVHTRVSYTYVMDAKGDTIESTIIRSYPFSTKK